MEKSKVRNRALILRAQQAFARREADGVLAERKDRSRSLVRCVEAGLAGVGAVGGCAVWVAELVNAHPVARSGKSGRCWVAEQARFGCLLRALAGSRSSILDSKEGVRAVWRVACLVGVGDYVRAPEAWEPPRSKNAVKQWGLWMRHLLCRYPMAAVFDGGWWSEDPRWKSVCGWWLHVASGKNLRTAEGLPIELSKRMAHEVMQSPVEGVRALRYGQFVAMGVTAALARAAAESGAGVWGAMADETWVGFGRFLAGNPLFPPAQVGPVVDFVQYSAREAARAEVRLDGVAGGDGGRQVFTFRGRTQRSLLRMLEDWHHRMYRVERYAHVGSWAASPIAVWERREGEGANTRLFRVEELLDSESLVDEGTAQRHCVGVYARSCAERRSAIFSMRVLSSKPMERLLTLEVRLPEKELVQARGRCNRVATQVETRVLRAWAAAVGVKVVRM